MNDDSNPIGRVISGPAAPLERAAAAWRDQPVDWDRMAEAATRVIKLYKVFSERYKHDHVKPLHGCQAA